MQLILSFIVALAFVIGVAVLQEWVNRKIDKHMLKRAMKHFDEMGLTQCQYCGMFTVHNKQCQRCGKETS